MIRQAYIGFLTSALSLRTIATVAIYGLLLLSKISLSNEVSPIGAWGYVLPIVSDPLWISLIWLTWLLAWTLPRALASARDIALIRAGSLHKLLYLELSNLFGAMLALALLLSACSLGVAIQLGVPSSWTTEAVNTTLSQSVFSADQLAKWFSSPMNAYLMSVLYAFLGAFTLAQVILVLAISQHSRSAVLFAIVSWLWIVLSSFSPVDIPLPIDGAIIVSIAWALANPPGILLGIAWWMFLWLASNCFLLALRGQKTLRAFLSDRLTVAIVCQLLFTTSALLAGSGSPASFQSFISLMFPGLSTDLLSYLIQAAIPLTISTAFVTRLIELRNGFFELQLLRWGKSSKWLRRAVLAETVRALVTIVALFPIVCVIGIFTSGNPTLDSVLVTFVGLLGFFAVASLQIVIALLLFRLSRNLPTAWMIFVAFVLFVGYWFPDLNAWISVAVPVQISEFGFASQTNFLSLFVSLATAAVIFYTLHFWVDRKERVIQMEKGEINVRN